MRLLRPLVLATSLATLVAPHPDSALVAQPGQQLPASPVFPVNDPALQRMWRLGMDSSRAARYGQALLDSIGPRLTGSPAHKAGNDWLVAQYKELGIAARNERYGTWKSWRRGTTHVDLVAPRVRSLEGTILAWSPGTDGRDVTAETIILPELADSAAFVAWLPQARGKLVLVSFAEPTCRPDDNWEKWGTPQTVERMKAQRDTARRAWAQRVQRTGYALQLGSGTLGRRLDEAGAAGVISNRWSAGWGVDKIFDAKTTKAPAITLSCEDYGLVYRLTENRQGPKLRVRADAQFLGEQPVFNTIAEIKGSEKPNEYVVLSAHFDSWDGGSGATDNGTGTVTMLEAMRILKAAYPNPKRTILVGHWGGEEQGLNGSRSFVADHPEIVQGLQALFNQDNGTGRVSTLSAAGLVDASGHLARWMSRVPAQIAQHVSFNFPGSPAGGGSDYAAFLCHGAPGFNLSSNSWDYGTYTWHTNRDTYDKISWDDVKNNATLAAILAYQASEDPSTTPRARREATTGANGQPVPWPACQRPARASSESTR